MKQVLFISIIITFCLTPCLAQKSRTLSNTEKIQIIKEILSDTDFSNGSSLDEGGKVVNLSTKNLPGKFKLTKISGVKIQLSTLEQVEEESKTGFGYYIFERFEVKNSKILLTFNYYWKNENARMFFSESTDYEYRKISGRWKRTKKMLRPNAMS